MLANISSEAILESISSQTDQMTRAWLYPSNATALVTYAYIYPVYIAPQLINDLILGRKGRFILIRNDEYQVRRIKWRPLRMPTDPRKGSWCIPTWCTVSICSQTINDSILGREADLFSLGTNRPRFYRTADGADCDAFLKEERFISSTAFNVGPLTVRLKTRIRIRIWISQPKKATRNRTEIPTVRLTIFPVLIFSTPCSDPVAVVCFY